MNLEYLKTILKDQPKYRLKQIEEVIYRDGITDWDKATALPLKLREELKNGCPLDIDAEVFESRDGGTVRILMTLVDGSKIESVLMKHRDRFTVCVSSQVGCSLRCDFCATGAMGMKRNLTENEIVEQVLFFSRYIKEHYNIEDRVTNVVFMGMGEPFLNYDAVISAARAINDEKKFNIGARKISISTSGIVDGIEKLASEDLQLNLAISLHAPNNKMRSRLMPINKKHRIEDIFEAVDNYIAKTSRQVMIEYILIKGINDSTENALELADLVRGRLCVVNVIACNPVGTYKPSPTEIIEEFIATLEGAGVKVIQRYRFGTDINAACGQLAGK